MRPKERLFKFVGVWVPPLLLTLIHNGELNERDMLLFSVIQTMQKRDGCFAGNEQLARWLGVSVSVTRACLANLKKHGLVEVRNDENRRFLLVRLDEVKGGGAASGCRGVQPLAAPDRTLTDSSSLSEPFTPSRRGRGEGEPEKPKGTGHHGNTGFGVGTLIEDTDTEAEFDKNMAALLEQAVRKLPSRRTGLTQAKPSTWAAAFGLLRTQDNIPEKDIHGVLVWYTAHIGEEFIPEAFSGDAFRRKFHTIEAQSKRDVTATVVVSHQAAKAAHRLWMMGWPKGSADQLPGAVQVGMDRYSTWRRRARELVERLRRGDQFSVATKSARLRQFGEHLMRILPASDHFNEMWLEALHERVRTWEAWSGDITPFSPDSKQFRSTGRGWSGSYSGDPNMWDHFVEAMKEIE